MNERSRDTGLLELPGEALALLAEAVLSLRTTGDAAVSWGIACANATRALGAADARLLRVDRRSGALFRFDESGVETPYLAEDGGPVHRVMRSDRASYDDGSGPADVPRETLLWQRPPKALTTVPLVAGSTHYGIMLLAFDAPRVLAPAERLFVQSLSDALALALERAEMRRELDRERNRVADAERRLSSVHEAASGLLAIVAHELRSPLSSIKAYAETLAGNLDNRNAPREKFLSVIDEECDRLSGLLGDVHDLSRLEGGEHTLRLTNVLLSELWRDACSRVAEQAGRRGVTLAVESDSDGRADIDADLVRRVITNLLQNAVQFSPAGGTIRVVHAVRGEECTGSITDSGAPLPAADLDSAFEGFYRARRVAAAGHTTAEGTRLGLAIARSIVNLHGGRMWAEQPVEGGARFCFALPVRQVAPARARRIARQTVGREDLRNLFGAVVDMVAVTLEAEIASLMLVDPDRGDLFVASAVGFDAEGVQGRRTMLRSGIAGAVAAWGRPVLVENIETDRRFRRLNHPQYLTKSLVCVPLRVESEVVGVLNVNNKTNGESFDEDDLGLLVMLTERVSSAIERACTYPDSGRVVEDVLEAVRCMTQLKRELSLGGRQMVRRARALAREMGMSTADVDVVGYVASIHDVGMVRFGAETGHRGLLDARQRDAVAGHPEVSIEILRPIEYLGVVREIILGHHERWDGTGYPRGLEGEAVPLGSRILAVVDAWESMTSPRPFRPARSAEDAAAELRREAGRQFDGQVVEAFERILEREGVARAAA